IASFVSITGGGRLILRDFCGIATGCRLLTGNDDYLGGCLTGPTIEYPYRIVQRGSIEIDKHAIIGANSVIFPNVTIGTGTIVGANSLVKSNLEEWTIYAGSPVRKIKERRRERILELEESYLKRCFDSNGNYIERRLRERKSC
ncbi:MAG: acetyltransferase, partial [Solivirus sp.]